MRGYVLAILAPNSVLTDLQLMGLPHYLGGGGILFVMWPKIKERNHLADGVMNLMHDATKAWNDLKT